MAGLRDKEEESKGNESVLIILRIWVEEMGIWGASCRKTVFFCKESSVKSEGSRGGVARVSPGRG